MAKLETHFKSDSLYIIPLGGLGEIGKNMLAILHGPDLLVVDAGVMFPKEEFPGIDLVIPDIRFLIEQREKLKGIFLTHGHEDHIGALPYLLPKLNAPVYGTRLTLGLVKGKLKEFSLDKKTEFHEIKPGNPMHFEKISVDCFPNVHSISDSVGLIFDTPLGRIVHSGDFKFDQTPVNGMITDFLRLASLGEEGVILLLSDSTYAERPGYSLPEKLVRQSLEKIFDRAKGRIILATFASSLPRIQQIIDTAANHGRRVCIMGRSMVENVSIAADLGYLHIPDNLSISPAELQDYPNSEIAILTTGSQGEPLSALALMASHNYKSLEILAGDTVVISAAPIPGNEGLVYRTINQLFKAGADVIYTLTTKQNDLAENELRVHVQGHASQEELKLFLNLVKPKFFIPIHGEYRHLIHHARLANEVGVPTEHAKIALDGDVVELTREKMEIVDRLSIENIFVDGYAAGGIGKSVLKERKNLAQGGILVLSIVLKRETGELLLEPEFFTKGFISDEEKEETLAQAAAVTVKFFQEIQGKTRQDEEIIKGNLKGELGRLFGEKTGRKPMIIPVISWL